MGGVSRDDRSHRCLGDAGEMTLESTSERRVDDLPGKGQRPTDAGDRLVCGGKLGVAQVLIV